MGSGTCEAVFVKTILQEIPEEPSVEVILESDSQAAISSQLRPGMGKMKHVELKYMFMQQMIKEGKVKIKKILGTENSSDLGTKYLERRDFEKHRAAAGLMSMSGTTPRYEVDAVESKESSSFALFASGAAKCMAGLALLTQSKTAEGADMSEKAQLDDTWVRVWTMMMDFVMQIFVISLMICLAFGLGYMVGARHNGAKAAAPPTAASTTPVAGRIISAESKTTQTVGYVTVEAVELTRDALRERLRQQQSLVSGLKEDLVNRYLRYLEERHLVLTRPP